jgi:DNA-binding MarR family transcriptional regulator
MEISNEIGYTHPSTISLLKELEEQKLIRSKANKEDERKRMIELTKKGKELVGQMESVWKIMTASLIEILDTKNHLLQAIEEVEEKLDRQSFFQKAKSLM